MLCEWGRLQPAHAGQLTIVGPSSRREGSRAENVMKLIVQIPCLNEARDIAVVIRAVPRQIEGVESVEVLVVDDGSTDRTVEVARQAGLDRSNFRRIMKKYNVAT